MADLLVIVPTRSRPEAVSRVVDAWRETDAFAVAELLFVYDMDDPRASGYFEAFDWIGWSHVYPIRFQRFPRHKQLVPKLNGSAVAHAGEFFALGFAGDDHLPRTPGWAQDYLRALRSYGTGIVSCPDGYRTDELPTQWAMTADIVRALGAMVPAPVEHLYCDDAIRALADMADCYSYLRGHTIEHMNPYAGKAEMDEQYQRVNGGPQYKRDRRAYRTWRANDLPRQAEAIRQLRKVAS